MPFRSNAQRRYLMAKKPALAKKWAKKYGTKPKPNSKKKTRKRRGRR